MITIDGAHGEGGGQIVRSSLALALATGQAFHLTRVRANRSRPGLLRQHLTAVEAARTISGAEVEGAALRSRELRFTPGPIVPGDYRFAIGTAGSTLLVVQALLPAVLAGPPGAAWQLELEGGTHNPMAPSFDFFVRVLAPLLAGLGAPVIAELVRAGFYPAGGGRIRVAVAGDARLDRSRRFTLIERGDVRERRVTALVSVLPRSIGERELATACRRLGWEPSTGRVEVLDGASGRAGGPGNTVTIAIDTEHAREVFTGHGAKGVPAERVALEVADEAAAWLDADVPVGSHLADQLIVPLALGGGGRFRTVAPTPHTTTQIDLVRWFLGVEVAVEQVGPDAFEIDVPAAPG